MPLLGTAIMRLTSRLPNSGPPYLTRQKLRTLLRPSTVEVIASSLPCGAPNLIRRLKGVRNQLPSTQQLPRLAQRLKRRHRA